ncbi:MAG: hypothetical protein R3F43_00510 [bacterium]
MLEWVNREIARRINKFHDRSGQALVPSTAIQITTLEKALDRLRYVMGQGTAAMKSRHPNDDVFACSNPALLRGEKLHGVFVHADGRREETTVRIDRLPGLSDPDGEGAPGADGLAGRRHRRRSPPAAQEGGPAGARPRGGAAGGPDDAAEGARPQPRAGGAWAARAPGGVAQAPRRARTPTTAHISPTGSGWRTRRCR